MSCPHCLGIDRRALLLLLGLGVASVLAGCDDSAATGERTNELAASIGYTNVLMWNGSYGDSALLRPRTLLNLAREYLHPGVIMLGHANHPTVTHLFPRIAEIIASRDLHPVTLDEMFGTSRRTGRST
jgi:peptidoglycan-N-acetylglucosamine deacetylase